jgi:arylsulfatase
MVGWPRPPRRSSHGEPESKGLTPESFQWELYNLNDDFSQGNDLAKTRPEKVKELQELWWSEAAATTFCP